MGTKTKSFLSAVALGFGLLFFGPATSDAQAQHVGPRVEFRGQFPLPHGSIGVYASNGGHHGNRYGKHYRNRSYSSAPLAALLLLWPLVLSGPPAVPSGARAGL